MSHFIDLTKKHDDIDIATPDDIKKIIQEIGFSSSKAMQKAVEQLNNTIKDTIKESFNFSINPANEALSELIGSIGRLAKQAFDVSDIINNFPDYGSLIATDTFAEAHNALLPVINEYVPYEKLDDAIKENLKPVKPKSKLTIEQVCIMISTTATVAQFIISLISAKSNDNRQYNVNSNNQYITETVLNIQTINYYIETVINEASVNTSNETEAQKDDTTED